MTASAHHLPPDEALAAWVATHHDELVAFRRHLHAHPELSGQEVETTASVAERLLVAGLTPRVLPGGTGLVCDLDGDATGPRVALRADLDALAMQDEKDVPYRSTRAGVAHACGHDVHTTVVLGAGLALHDLGRRSGSMLPVRLVFQPSEEQLPGGALDVIAHGGLDGVTEILGVHCDPRLEVGRLGLTVGPITSATDMAAIHLHGPGGHTARPERTVDLVRLAGRVAVELPGRVEQSFGGRPARITFGAVHAGDAPNVIPATADLLGTVRTPDATVWGELEDAVGRALAELLHGSGASWELDYTPGHPPVVNDPVATAHLVDATRAVLGDDGVAPTHQSVGGDDFSWYLEHVPGCYARLGVRGPGDPDGAVDLHAACFDVDEACIGVGVQVLAEATRLAVATLSRPAEGPVTTADS